MRTWIVLGLIIAIPLASGSLQPSDEAQFWAASGVDQAFVRLLINNQECHSSPEYLRACESAVPLANGDFDLAVERITAQTPQFTPEVAYGRVVNRLLREFDPHARLVPTAQIVFERSLQSGDYVGIGITKALTSGGLIIREVFRDSPAERAGLLSGDRIVRIDGLPAGTGARLSGAFGSRLTLQIERHGVALQKRVVIATVVRRHVESRTLGEGARKVGYLRLSRFVHGVCDIVRGHLEAMQDVGGWILDLRGNPGGLMDEVKCLAAHLLGGSARIVGQRSVDIPLPKPLGLKSVSTDKEVVWEMGWSDRQLQNKPLVILINYASASSSEILAAALQDHGRAVIVGEPSFGKGSAQLAESLARAPGLSVVHTVSLFYRPLGPGLQRRGVEPDVVVSGGELAPAREGQVFARALPAGPLSVVFELKRGFARSLRKCVATQRRDPTRWKDFTKTADRFDLQLAHALVTLECISLN